MTASPSVWRASSSLPSGPGSRGRVRGGRRPSRSDASAASALDAALGWHRLAGAGTPHPARKAGHAGGVRVRRCPPLRLPLAISPESARAGSEQARCQLSGWRDNGSKRKLARPVARIGSVLLQGWSRSRAAASVAGSPLHAGERDVGCARLRTSTSQLSDGLDGRLTPGSDFGGIAAPTAPQRSRPAGVANAPAGDVETRPRRAGAGSRAAGGGPAGTRSALDPPGSGAGSRRVGASNGRSASGCRVPDAAPTAPAPAARPFPSAIPTGPRHGVLEESGSRRDAGTPRGDQSCQNGGSSLN
jgi:hypothetical protein